MSIRKILPVIANGEILSTVVGEPARISIGKFSDGLYGLCVSENPNDPEGPRGAIILMRHDVKQLVNALMSLL